MTNAKKINETKIKKLNKLINELQFEEEKYENLINKKDRAMEKIKNIVDEINIIKQFQS